jgi:hypothetical protein
VKKYTTAIGVCFGMLVLLAGSVIYALRTNKTTPVVTQKSTSSQQSTGGLQATNEQAISQGQASSGLAVGNDQSSLGLQSNLGQSNNNAQTLPGPSSFGQYDQYKDNTTAMYAEPVVGTGKEATQGKKVAMLYQGWLTNGQLFDESKPNAEGQYQPLIFTLGSGEVIPGWDQGIAGMKVGGKRRLIIPPAAGYGTAGQGPIPANAVLVFDVQLVDAE